MSTSFRQISAGSHRTASIAQNTDGTSFAAQARAQELASFRNNRDRSQVLQDPAVDHSNESYVDEMPQRRQRWQPVDLDNLPQPSPPAAPEDHLSITDNGNDLLSTGAQSSEMLRRPSPFPSDQSHKSLLSLQHEFSANIQHPVVNLPAAHAKAKPPGHYPAVKGTSTDQIRQTQTAELRAVQCLTPVEVSMAAADDQSSNGPHVWDAFQDKTNGYNHEASKQGRSSLQRPSHQQEHFQHQSHSHHQAVPTQQGYSQQQWPLQYQAFISHGDGQSQQGRHQQEHDPFRHRDSSPYEGAHIQRGHQEYHHHQYHDLAREVSTQQGPLTQQQVFHQQSQPVSPRSDHFAAQPSSSQETQARHDQEAKTEQVAAKQVHRNPFQEYDARVDSFVSLTLKEFEATKAIRQSRKQTEEEFDKDRRFNQETKDAVAHALRSSTRKYSVSMARPSPIGAVGDKRPVFGGYVFSSSPDRSFEKKEQDESDDVFHRLLLPVMANLKSYSLGEKDYFNPFVRAPDWTIDHSPAGQQSYFGEDWGTPPARVGRDPRYRAMQHDTRGQEHGAGMSDGYQPMQTPVRAATMARYRNYQDYNVSSGSSQFSGQRGIRFEEEQGMRQYGPGGEYARRHR